MKQGREEQTRLKLLVDKYEYVMGLAERNIKSEKELEEVEADILQRKNAAAQIDERIRQMQLVAQRRLVEESIERRARELTEAYEDVQALRAEYAELEELPDIPEATREAIEREVRVAIQKPFELPRSFVFRALLLIALSFFVPWPVDAVVGLAFLQLFISLFFEAAEMYADPKVTHWVRKHANSIGVWSAIALWYVLLSFLQNLVVGSASEFLRIERLWSTTNAAMVLLSVFAGLLHWRLIRPSVVQVLPVEPAPAT